MAATSANGPALSLPVSDPAHAALLVRLWEALQEGEAFVVLVSEDDSRCFSAQSSHAAADAFDQVERIAVALNASRY